jgi:hypothetical protein
MPPPPLQHLLLAAKLLQLSTARSDQPNVEASAHHSGPKEGTPWVGQQHLELSSQDAALGHPL